MSENDLDKAIWHLNHEASQRDKENQMRPIKFRAWDRDNKRFGYFSIQDNSITWPNSDWLEQQIVEGQFIRFPGIDSWQQFTGFRDENDRDIYEGDIVEVTWATGRKERVQMFWSLTQASFCWMHGKPGCDDGHSFEMIEQFQPVVIGNIYENEELANP